MPGLPMLVFHQPRFPLCVKNNDSDSDKHWRIGKKKGQQQNDIKSYVNR